MDAVDTLQGLMQKERPVGAHGPNGIPLPPDAAQLHRATAFIPTQERAFRPLPSRRRASHTYPRAPAIYLSRKRKDRTNAQYDLDSQRSICSNMASA